MRFTLTIDCDNAAFHYEESGEPNPWPEVARLLQVAEGRVAISADSGKLLDYNGNTVGRFGFEE